MTWIIEGLIVIASAMLLVFIVSKAIEIFNND